MGDDYDCEATLALSEELTRNFDTSAPLNVHCQAQEAPLRSSLSHFTNEVTQEKVLTSFSLPHDFCDAVEQKASSVNFGEELDNTDSREMEENLERTDGTSNDTVFLVKQEEKGFKEERGKLENTCMMSAVWEKEERKGFGTEKADSGSAIPICTNDVVLMEQPLMCGPSENIILGVSKFDTSVSDLEYREKGVSGIQEKLEFHEMNSRDDTNDGSLKKCSLKISVIDETALIDGSEIGEGIRERKVVKNVKYNEHHNGGNKERRSRRKGKTAKSKNYGVDVKENNLDLSLNDCGIGILDGVTEKRQKNAYSRKVLEGMRHVGLERQRKKWTEIYCGLGQVVQQEYDGLVGCVYHHQYHNPNQKNFLHVDCNGGSSILGEGSSEKIADNKIAAENPLDSGLPPVNHEHVCSIEQEYEEDDSDDDHSSIQKPAFFVSGEPNFDSGPPEDGLEYLRRVRWEAAQLPKVKVAKVDKSKLNKEQTNYMPQIPDVAVCPEQLMPSKEWEDVFLADFSDLRLALSCNEDSDEQLQSSTGHEESSSKLLEGDLENFDSEPCERDSSTQLSIRHTLENPHTTFVANDTDGSDAIQSSGSKLSDSGASVEYPTMSMIMHMDSVARVSALRKRINMAENTSNLCRNDCLWLFALSAAVDSPLDADTCASFRSLLRKCASLRAGKLVLDEEVAVLNILATISGRYFGQLGH